MKYYNDSKVFDITTLKNAQEDEVRAEIINEAGREPNMVNNKSIHNKKKEYR